MKIALCLHGLVGTTNKYGEGERIINPKIGAKHFKQHLFNVNDDVDVYFHTWSEDQKEKLLDIYNPKGYKFETQPFFSESSRHQAIFCRWKSVKESLSLIKESGISYDFIFLTRFDLALLVDFDFSTLDKNKFYALGPKGPAANGINLINDLWFIASEENMNKFGTLFDCLGEEAYGRHIDSNHELSRAHLISMGLENSVEYLFNRRWTGKEGKLNSDTPLVRWHYHKLV